MLVVFYCEWIIPGQTGPYVSHSVFRSDTPGPYQPEWPRQHFHSRWNPEGAWTSITNRQGGQQFIKLHGAGKLCSSRDTPAVCHDGPQQTEACHVSSFYPAEMQGETLFAFILLSSPLPFPTPLSVPLSRIAWIRSRALKCFLNHKRAEVLLCLSCWQRDPCAACTHSSVVGSLFGVRLCNPFPDNYISRSVNHLDLFMIGELGEAFGSGHVQFSCSCSLKSTTRWSSFSPAVNKLNSTTSSL